MGPPLFLRFAFIFWLFLLLLVEHETYVLCNVNYSKNDTVCKKLPKPKSYVVYKLQASQKISIDGKLNEDVWGETARTEDFVDIQGDTFPKPRFQTWAKLRWDDRFLYIGAFLEETDVFANQTMHNSVVFKDNDFEVFINPDWSTHWYKEFEINAINTTWDLELSKPYMNGGTPNNSFEMPSMKTAIYVDGPINDPKVKNKYWTVELALPFSDLIRENVKVTAPPKNRDQWRINFSRVEWHVKNVNGHYEKVPGVPEDNWVWSPQHAINMHLPERWGIIQFSSDAVNQTVFTPSPDWPVYDSLVHVYNAEKKFFAVQGYYTTRLNQLELPAYVADGECASKPYVVVDNNYSFNATVEPLFKEYHTGHVRDDRLIWFTGP
ncbi:uncharacterized protein LOC117104355 [Anneissia japonica]|uniref:uncharacterized protein LOC117104355 n=1 Tax=Anneissia japonica TaxID=1529436 RepID=UPI0014258F98|nr:uncharacterized protein LOC117104355 [Anneissia japonica]